MPTIKEMRDRAERYRRNAALLTDDKTRDALMRMARELEEQADQIEAQLGLQDRAD